MRSASTVAEKRQPDGAGGKAHSLTGAIGERPILFALLILAVVTVIRAQGTVDGDVSWQLWIGRQLNHGAHLYRDIIDTNPPLWFWMAMPVDRLSALVHLRSDHLLILLVGCAAALSVAATGYLIRTMRQPGRTLLLAYASLLLVAMPWLEIGQREHIALIGAVPYAALIAARRSQRIVPTSFALAVGAGAALGFALKHYFLIVPLFLELWLLGGQGKRWRPLRAETAAIAVVGSAYVIALILFAHEYLTAVLPMLLLAYGATGAKHVIDLFQPAVLTALASIAVLIGNYRFLRSESSGTAAALAVAVLAFAIVYFIQAKGWSYHAVPMAALAAMALAASLAAGSHPPRLILFTAPALLLLPFWTSAQNAENAPGTTPDIDHALAGVPAGEPVGFISTNPSFGWPAVLNRGFAFPLRYNGFWMMQAIVTNEIHGGKNRRLTQLGRSIVRETVDDFECTPPRLIIVDRPTPAEARAGAFDILAFFLRDHQFAHLLAHYRPIRRTSAETFELVIPFARRRGCPSWSPV